MKQHICKNCEHVFEGNFCNHCGQKSKTERLDFHYLQDEIKYTFLHINKGLLYSVKQLIVRPADTVREFIEGKRIGHYKPILLLVVLAGINGLLYHYFINIGDIFKESKAIMIGVSKEQSEAIAKKVMDWIYAHYSLFEIVQLPFVSLASYLAFKKYGYNYIENIIINSFAASQRLIYTIIIFPLIYLASKTNHFILITNLVSLPIFLITIWFYIKLFKDKVIGDVIVRLLLFGFLVIVLFIIMIFIAVAFVAMFVDKSQFGIH